MKQTIFDFDLDGEKWEIKMTSHAYLRMKKRFNNLDEFEVSGDIVGLGKKRLRKHIKREDDIAIIDKDKGLSIIVSFDESHKKWIKIITLIDKSDIYVKEGTTLEEL